MEKPNPVEESIQDPLIQEDNKKRFSRKLIIIVIVITIIILGILGFFLASKVFKKKPNPTPPTSISPINNSNINWSVSPDITFQNYIFPKQKPDLKSLPVYALKQNYTLSEIKTISQKLGLISVETQGNTVISYSLPPNLNAGLLEFDTKTGALNYTAFNGYKISAAQTSPQETATIFLKDIGIYDKTITCSVTYKKTTAPNITFVECHREWGLLGAPLITLGGIFNIPETQQIRQLTVGKTSWSSPDDSTVTQVSNGENGKTRPNDFNTATIGISQNGKVISAVSNIRPFSDKNAAPEVSQLITSQAAEQEFRKNSPLYTFTIPAGEGIVDWDKVYPENKAFGKNAYINDMEVVYLEKPIGEVEEKYLPFYMIRGTSTLESGYTVRFTSLIPAEKSGNTGEIASEIYTLQLKTFRPITIREISPNPPSLSPQTCTMDQKILLANQGQIFAQTIQVKGYGEIDIGYGGKAHTIFWKPKTGESISNREKVLDTLFTAIEDQYVLLYKQGAIKNLPPNKGLFLLYASPANPNASRIMKMLSNFDKRLSENNLSISTQTEKMGVEQIESIFPLSASYSAFDDILMYGQATGTCYLTGASPSLFIYTSSPTSLTLTTSFPLTYADPSFTKELSFVSHPDGHISTSFTNDRSHIYYEYDKSITLKPLQYGYVVNRNALQGVTTEIAEKLALNPEEIFALESEINKELPGITQKYIKLQLIDSHEVEKKLPLDFSVPIQNRTRIHFLMTGVNKLEHIQAPSFSPIHREGNYLVEIGAFQK